MLVYFVLAAGFFNCQYFFSNKKQQEKMDSNVFVAIRVRPFNSRENELKSQLIVSMTANETVLTNPNFGTKASGDAKEAQYKFAFDASYFSHDKNASNFATQETVFKDLGGAVLKNAYEGYNICLFA